MGSRVLRWILLGIVGLLVVGVGLLIAYWIPVQHWLAVHTGTVNESGEYYGFWSGFGADLGEVTLVTTVAVGVYTGVRKTNCHVKGCWRIGHHPLEGTPYHLCAIHHPDVPAGGASHAEILEHHHAAMRDRLTGRVHSSATASPPAPAASSQAAQGS